MRAVRRALAGGSIVKLVREGARGCASTACGESRGEAARARRAGSGRADSRIGGGGGRWTKASREGRGGVERWTTGERVARGDSVTTTTARREVGTMAGDPKAPEGYDVVREGEARALQRADTDDVFYNKPQVVNRDMSIAVIREFQRVRAAEHAEGKVKRNKRAKGTSCLTPRDDPLVKRLLDEDDVAALFRTAEEHRAMLEKQAAEREARGEKEGETEKVVKPLTNVTILEGMSATGLRALRYAQEIKDVGCIVANDLDPTAAEAIERNKAYNALCSPAKADAISCVIPHNEDVRMVCMKHEKMFDVVDLDPYGTPSTLLDSAVTAVKEGGLLLVTATDMAVLCGNNSEVAWAKYQSYPLRAKYCHEMAVRTLLASIENAAIKHKRHIVPVLSLSIDFYIRVFVRVYTSPLQMKSSPSKLSYVFQCVGCDAHELQPVGRKAMKGDVTKYQPGAGPVVPQKCPSCGWHYNMGGPIWSDPIHDKDWVNNIKAEVEKNESTYPGFVKVHALLTMAQEELPDVPLHYDLHAMGGTLKCTPPTHWLFKSAIINAGYRVSSCHSSPKGIKTDAPVDVLWDILRCWVKEHPVKPVSEKTPGSVILAKEPTIKANFTRVSSAQSKARQERVARFPQNPTENWGPKRRAGKFRDEESDAKKRRADMEVKRRAEEED